MKKSLVLIAVILIVSLLFGTCVFATNSTTLENNNKSNISTVKIKQDSKLQEYIEKYQSETYGFVAYILNIVRWYSIPVCFLGIVVGALNQYVLGTRRLDRKHRGQALILTFVTLLVICQVLPLVFTLVVIGWRG